MLLNQTDSPLFVTSRVYDDDEAGAMLELRIIGEPLDMRYALHSAVTETGMIEEPAYIRDRDGLYAKYSDERVPVGEAQMGYAAVVTRTAESGEGSADETEEISSDTYEAIPPTIYVGIEDRE